MPLENTKLLPSGDTTMCSVKEENDNNAQSSVLQSENVLVASFDEMKQKSVMKETEYSDKQQVNVSDQNSLNEVKAENDDDMGIQKHEQTVVKKESGINNSDLHGQCQNQTCMSETFPTELQKTKVEAEVKTKAEAEVKTKAEAEEKTKVGAEVKTKLEVEEKTEAEAEQKCEVTTSCSEEHDPYFYTKREDFTSEIFKIEIRNLPQHLSYGQLRKFFNVQLGLNTHKIKPVGSPRALQCVYATFRNEEQREKALKLLDGYKWKGRKLVVKKANPMADPLVKKRSAGDSEDAPAIKKIRQNENIPVLVRIKNAVTPLWNVSYEEQLKKKESDMRQVLISLGRGIEKVNKSFHALLDEVRKANSFQCCPMADVKASPCVSGYRNKCEFTVGRHLDTNEKVVGFRLSSYKEGSMSVAEPDECPHISQAMLKAVKCFQSYIQASDKDVYNPETHEGYWRQLTVRTSRIGGMMIIIVMHPQNLAESELEKEKQELISYFTSGPAASCGITSAFFQIFARKQSQHEEANLIHLFGEKFIEEILLGNTFRISPNAFFQVNSDGAEVLYKTVAEVVGENKSSAALDICCGTGTIGICLSKQASKVVGIEMVQQAVEDAKVNAQINGIANVEFVQGKAEDVITDVINKLDNSELTAVVDPPRAGLHPKVLKVIRGCEKIKRLIYVSCNVKAAMSNFVDLCRPPSNNYKGQPFYPVQAIPIDLFPHTPYCELILIFERPDTSILKK